MSLNDAILITASGLMLYGIVQHILNSDEFWLSPIGNVIGAIAVTVVVGAAFPLMVQDDTLILLATVLALFWMTRGKRRRYSPATPAGNVTFDQVLTPV